MKGRKMKKVEFIAKKGEAAWEKHLEQTRAWLKAHREEEKARVKKYREAHPEKVKEANRQRRIRNPEKEEARNREISRKGGKYYDKFRVYNHTGLRGARRRIRAIHQTQYRPFKRIIAPDSQIHHEWIPKTAEYRGVALVEKDAHQYGIIDVIQILDGEITLLTEEDIKKDWK